MRAGDRGAPRVVVRREIDDGAVASPPRNSGGERLDSRARLARIARVGATAAVAR